MDSRVDFKSFMELLSILESSVNESIKVKGFIASIIETRDINRDDVGFDIISIKDEKEYEKHEGFRLKWSFIENRNEKVVQDILKKIIDSTKVNFKNLKKYEK